MPDAIVPSPMPLDDASSSGAMPVREQANDDDLGQGSLHIAILGVIKEHIPDPARQIIAMQNVIEFLRQVIAIRESEVVAWAKAAAVAGLSAEECRRRAYAEARRRLHPDEWRDFSPGDSGYSLADALSELG